VVLQRAEIPFLYKNSTFIKIPDQYIYEYPNYSQAASFNNTYFTAMF